VCDLGEEEREGEGDGADQFEHRGANAKVLVCDRGGGGGVGKVGVVGLCRD